MSGNKKEVRSIEYMCRTCGHKTIKRFNYGRPEGGKCPKKKNGGPHSWVVNRKIY